jgi:hypothetical protein
MLSGVPAGGALRACAAPAGSKVKAAVNNRIFRIFPSHSLLSDSYSHWDEMHKMALLHN